MSRIVETTVFKFEELSEAVKENARQWWRDQWWRDRENQDFDISCIYEDAERMGTLLGIEFDGRAIPLMGGGTHQEPTIYYSGFSSQGDGACFEGRYQYAKGAPKTIKAEAPQDAELLRIAVELQKIQARNFYQLTASTKHSGHYYHSGCMSVDVERDDEKEMTEDAEEEVTQLLRDFANWIYSQLEAEYDYVMSDEHADESIGLSEYEFTSEGAII